MTKAKIKKQILDTILWMVDNAGIHTAARNDGNCGIELRGSTLHYRGDSGKFRFKIVLEEMKTK